MLCTACACVCDICLWEVRCSQAGLRSDVIYIYDPAAHAKAGSVQEIMMCLVNTYTVNAQQTGGGGGGGGHKISMINRSSPLIASASVFARHLSIAHDHAHTHAHTNMPPPQRLVFQFPSRRPLTCDHVCGQRFSGEPGLHYTQAA